MEPSSEGSIIHLTFESFDVENHRDCKWDYVKVSYGSFNRKFCGSSIPGPFISDTSITVQIHTDHTVFKSGFSAKWTITISSGVTEQFSNWEHQIYLIFCLQASNQKLQIYLNLFCPFQVVLLAGLIFLTHLAATDISLKPKLGRMLGTSVLQVLYIMETLFLFLTRLPMIS